MRRHLYATLVLPGMLLFALTNTYAQLPQADVEHNQRKQAEFLAFNANYEQLKNSRIEQIKTLGMQVYMQELSGREIKCAHQILSELIWLISSTADFKRIDQRLADLKAVCDAPVNSATAKDPFGGCYSEWFFKMVAHYGELRHSKTELSPYAFLLDTINSPEKLTNYFKSVSVSDIAHTGVDHYREFNESLSDLMRLILNDRPQQYAYHLQLKQTLMNLILHDFRNPATGFWGESYLRDGKVQFIDDLSMTFHTVSYLKGNVPDLDRVLKTMLAIKTLDFPVGWLYKGQYWNHNNMDVADLLGTCWPYADQAQKKEIAAEIEKMLNWCITQSLQADGSFKPVEADGSIEEGTYYGSSFLYRIGFFDKSKRFCTNQDFPEAEGIRQRIIAFTKKHMKSGATGGDYYSSVLDEIDPDANKQ